MANNCLITKLKVNVNNDNLPYLNSVGISFKQGEYEPQNRFLVVTPNDGMNLPLRSTVPVTIYQGSTIVASNVTEYDITASRGILFPNTNGSCFILNKAEINSLSKATNTTYPTIGSPSGFASFTIDASQLDYTLLTTINLNAEALSGVFDPKEANFYNIYIPNTYNVEHSCVVNIEKLSCARIVAIRFNNNSNVIGNIESMSISRLSGDQFINGTNITGDLKTLCDTWASNGKTGSVRFELLPTNVTWGGEALNAAKIQELTGQQKGDITITFANNSYTIS